MVESLTKEILVKFKALAACENSWRPFGEMYCRSHLEMSWKAYVEHSVERHASHNQRAWRSQDVGLNSAADLEPIWFVQIRISADRGKLEYLIVAGLAARCFGIVEHERPAPATRPANAIMFITI